MAKKTEEVIAKLKRLLDGIGRIDAPDLRARMVLSDGLSEQQQDILRIRHELGLTFDEIAEQISPSQRQRCAACSSRRTLLLPKRQVEP